MNTRQRVVLGLAIAGFVGAAGAAIAVRSAAFDEDGDEQVRLEQCPAAVQATIRAHLNGGTIAEIERTTDHGGVRYEVDVNGAGGIAEFNVGADGAYLGEEVDDDGGDRGAAGAARDADDDGPDEDGDVQVTLEQCPAAVQATIRAHVGAGTINEIERSPEGRFEVDANGANGQFEFVVGADGAYLGEEGDDDGEEDGR